MRYMYSMHKNIYVNSKYTYSHVPHDMTSLEYDNCKDKTVTKRDYKIIVFPWTCYILLCSTSHSKYCKYVEDLNPSYGIC